eukprot:1145525-Pelagomonas_calceolata.AAC.1
MSDSKNLIEPNSAVLTNTIGRAELATIAAPLIHKYQDVATDSLSSLHQLRKQILYPEKRRHHAKPHAGIAGNKCTDKFAKYQAILKKLTDTGIPSAGPGSNHFYNFVWLAQKEARSGTSESSSPIPNLIYFSDLKNASKFHMHAKHRLGYAELKTGYYTCYQSLLFCANKGIGNAF